MVVQWEQLKMRMRRLCNDCRIEWVICGAFALFFSKKAACSVIDITAESKAAGLMRVPAGITRYRFAVSLLVLCLTYPVFQYSSVSLVQYFNISISRYPARCISARCIVMHCISTYYISSMLRT